MATIPCPTNSIGNKAMDFHTHNLRTPPGAGIVCLPQEVLLMPDRWLCDDGHLPDAQAGALYALGIHPWWTAATDFDLDAHLAGLRRLLPLPEVVQLGECGFDRLRGTSIEEQRRIFEAQVALSETFAVPMTIHCVRAYDVLLAEQRRLRPTQRWTIHGFRGKPELARQLLAAGFDLSFGPRRNDESYALTPPKRRHDETDGSGEK